MGKAGVKKRPSPAPAAAKDVKSKIESLLHVRHALKSGVGIKVVSLQDGTVLYSLNNQRGYAPASTMKIVTMALALEKLGENFRWKTEVWADGPVQNGVLQGNLYVKGYGNPHFLEPDMEQLAHMVSGSGVQRITGQVFYDATYFDTEYNGPGVTPESGSFYDPIISALSYSYNLFSVEVNPGAKVGGPVSVSLYPASSFVQVVKKAKALPRRRTQLSFSYQKTTGTLIVSGVQSMTGMSCSRTYKIFQPERFFMHAFLDQLKNVGVQLTDTQIEAKEVEKGNQRFHLLALHHSPPLAEILSIMGKKSNNFIADQIFKTLGAETNGAPGSFEKGSLALGTYLAGLGYDPSFFRIMDGSGLSHDNRLSADILLTVLQRMYQSDILRPTFVESLAWAGIDGTLKERLTRSETQHKIFAKTGSLAGVSCLSGYVAAAKRGDLAFSIFINGAVGKMSAKRMEDEIVSVLAAE